MAACRGFDVVIAGPGEYLDEAGRIWAEATAFRDGSPDVAALDAARAVIKPVVRSSAQSLLLVALGNDNDALGFAVAVTAGPVHDRRAELRYLGVRPRAWAAGSRHDSSRPFATRLAAAASSKPNCGCIAITAAPSTCTGVRNRGLSADVRIHPRSRRREQRYTLTIATEPAQKDRSES
jgi:hypothetical protein